jgi:hypothetical protein
MLLRLNGDIFHVIRYHEVCYKLVHLQVRTVESFLSERSNNEKEFKKSTMGVLK